MKQFTKDGKIGFQSDWRDEVILEAQFDAVNTFCGPDGRHAGEGREWGVLKDGKWGLIDNWFGRWITPCTWEAVDCFRYGLAKVKWGGKWGFINRSGWVVTDCRWDEIEPFAAYGTTARAWRDGKVNYILTGGAVLFDEHSIFRDEQFDAVDTFYDPNHWHLDYGELSMGGHPGKGYEMGVLKNGKWGLINRREGQWITPCQWEAVSYFKNDLARVKRDGKWGFINTEGKLVSPCCWDEVVIPDYCKYWAHNVFRVKRDGKYGYLGSHARELIPCEWDAQGLYDENWTAVKRNGIWYLRNESGNLSAPGEHKGKLVFFEGLAVIYDGFAYGLINGEGREIVPCQWDTVERLPEDVNGLPWNKDEKIYSWDSPRKYPVRLVKVRKKKKWGIYDLSGKECCPCTLDKVWRFRNGVAKICENGKWGLIDEQGRIITPCKWEYVDYFRSEEAAVRLDGHWGAIDRSGNLVRPCTHFVGL